MQQLWHALAIGLSAVRVSPAHPNSSAAAWLFLAGITLFSGSLYGMALTNQRKLAIVTPLGGLLFLCGWAALAREALVIID